MVLGCCLFARVLFDLFMGIRSRNSDIDVRARHASCAFVCLNMTFFPYLSFRKISPLVLSFPLGSHCDILLPPASRCCGSSPPSVGFSWWMVICCCSYRVCCCCDTAPHNPLTPQRFASRRWYQGFGDRDVRVDLDASVWRSSTKRFTRKC